MSNNKTGARLSAEERAIEARKLRMWDSRVAFVRRGHLCMQNRQYGEAAVNYEKYIRTLEIIFGCQSGELTPQHFKETSRTSEMSILAGVYWDLIRIYDTSHLYGERQTKAALQLAQFAPLTPIHNDLVKRAKIFMKTAKHADKVKIFLVGPGKASRCFIATSAFESPEASEVIFLRHYRDSVLKKSFFGRKLVYFYYSVSPKIACVLDQHSFLKTPTRWALKLVIKCVSLF